MLKKHKQQPLKSMEEFAPANLPFLKLPCPYCGAKNPGWSYHDSYKRYLISFENNQLKIEEINITRIICSSCKHTHAVLPEIIIPYSSYSLLFVLSVLKDYFSEMSITNICEKYQISPSTLYGVAILLQFFQS
jgi:transposase